MLISIINNWVDAEEEHNAFLASLIDNFLVGADRKDPLRRWAWRFIRDSKTQLLSGTHSDILDTINRYKKVTGYFRRANKLKEFKKILRDIFDYDTFRNKHAEEGRWDAYKLCYKSKARLCPYCHQAFAFTVQPKKGNAPGYRPTLDHFYDRGRYPHLALVLNNLVPSCYSCNSSLKHSSDFSGQPHLHPLFDTHPVRLNIAPQDKHVSLSDLADLSSLPPDKIKITALNPTRCEKTRHSIETFLIDHRYQEHVVEALEMIKLKLSCNESRTNFGLTFLGVNLRETEILRFDRQNYEKHMLGALFAAVYDLCPLKP